MVSQLEGCTGQLTNSKSFLQNNMLKKIRLIVAATVILLLTSSCSPLRDTIDHGADRTKEVTSHIRVEAEDFRDKTLKQVDETLKVVVPRAVKDVLESEAVAFLTVSLTVLLLFVVAVAGFSIVGTVWNLWRRWRSG